MNPRVFREYDIRGNADADFPDDFVADLGRAIGAQLAEGGARRITLGRDCRLSSPRIHATLKRELLASGLDVIDVGVVHTPGLYFSVFHLEADGGVMFFAERWFGFDDAVYAGLRLVELLSRSNQTLAELYDTLPVLYNTPEIRMTCPDDVKFEVVKRAQGWFRERYEIVDIDGVRVQFKENGRQGKNVGWGLIRASNTGPVLVLRFEADSSDRLAEIKALVEGRLTQIMAEVGAPPPKVAAH